MSQGVSRRLCNAWGGVHDVGHLQLTRLLRGSQLLGWCGVFCQKKGFARNSMTAFHEAMEVSSQ